MSLDLLGAEPRGILIRVRNTRDLVTNEAKKRGDLAAAGGDLATTLVPETIESVVLNRMVSEFRKKMAEQGVDADVQIVSAAAHRPATSGFNMGVAAGLGVGAAGWALWRFGLSRFL